MWPQRLLPFLTVCVCHLVAMAAGAISVQSPQRSLTRSVMEDVLFSVNVSGAGVGPNVQWTFMSAAVSRGIGAWQPGGVANITVDYRDRTHAHANGSLGLEDLRLQDAGYYVLTVTDAAGSSKDAVFVLKVNEVLFEDIQYLSVFVAVLGILAALLSLSMWLMDRAYRWVKAWRLRRHTPENDQTELRPL